MSSPSAVVFSGQRPGRTQRDIEKASRLLDDAIAGYGGAEVSGDDAELVAVFADVGDAVRAVVAAQQAVAADAEGHGPQLEG